MVTKSYPGSVLNSVAVRVPAASTRIVHASLLPWLPYPSVTQVSLAVIWQYAPPETTLNGVVLGAEVVGMTVGGQVSPAEVGLRVTVRHTHCRSELHTPVFPPGPLNLSELERR